MIARTGGIGGAAAAGTGGKSRSGAARPLDPRGGLDFLGPEFLTWLWWRSEVAPRFEYPDGDSFSIHLDDHLDFRGERAAAKRASLRAGMPAASAEARAALRSGKTLAAARLLLARDEDEVRLTLRAEDLDISSLRLPAPEGDDAREREQDLLDRTRQVLDDVDLCFAAFLAVRCSTGWDAEAERLRAWSRLASQDERFARAGETSSRD